MRVKDLWGEGEGEGIDWGGREGKSEREVRKRERMKEGWKEMKEGYNSSQKDVDYTAGISACMLILERYSQD